MVLAAGNPSPAQRQAHASIDRNVAAKVMQDAERVVGSDLDLHIADHCAHRDQLVIDERRCQRNGNRVIRAGYELLGLQTYFTAGEKEVRAWTVRTGATAPQAAGVIHTDFERGFIRAEVIAYDDYIKFKGEAGSRDAGKLRLEGKEYIVKEGDVMHFRFNV